MLEAPRELYERALLPLNPDEPPPKPPELLPLLEGMFRLPILSPPAPVEGRLEALGEPERPAVPPAERFAVPALGDEPRDPPC